MTKEEKRKHNRIDSLHLLNYVYTDETSEETLQGMGRTLNVSEAGILLETHTPPLTVGSEVSLTIGFEEDVVDIKGKVVYSKESENDMYDSGIEFFDVDDDAMEILKRYITAFNSK